MNGSGRKALNIIILFGVVSLLGDVVYEGSRAITGPYLALLGAGAAAVGLVSGVGEFLGYALRLLSGYVSDRTKSYWVLTITGYGLIVAIPLLAFAGSWRIAALLVILERVGKAIRTPARDTILSFVSVKMGRGKGFGIHEFFDQLGAVLGPLFFSLALLLRPGNEMAGYRLGYALLWIPFFVMLGVLFWVRRGAESPENLERETSRTETPPPATLIFYMVFVFISLCGFAGFPLIAFHVKMSGILSDARIPALYILAMGVDGLAALAVGMLYDRAGLKALLLLPVCILFAGVAAFSASWTMVVAGVAVWGVAMGIQETIVRAAIADMSPVSKRGFTYGIFNTVYGGGLFVGGALIGILYQKSPGAVKWYIVGVEIVALLLFAVLAAGRVLSRKVRQTG